MSAQSVGVARIDRDELRRFISEKYSEVATNPELGYRRPSATADVAARILRVSFDRE